MPAADFIQTVKDPAWLARLEAASRKPVRRVLRRA
jgi:hypothetical protein